MKLQILEKFYCFLSVPQCRTNKFDTQINFCDDWCNTEGKWGCGLATIIGSDPRNTDGVDYQCDCSGCNGCGGKKIDSLKFYASIDKGNFGLRAAVVDASVAPN